MQYLYACLFIFFLCPMNTEALPEKATEGPQLLAKGDGYAIHAFRGMVSENAFIRRTEKSGYVIFHTDLKTGRIKWLLRTGNFSLPTRVVQTRYIRLLGVFQSETELALVEYSGKVTGVTDKNGKGGRNPFQCYRVMTFDKQTGEQLYLSPLYAVQGKTEEELGKALFIPEKETIETGLFQRTEEGFSVLGHDYVISKNGRILPKKAAVKLDK